MFRLWMALAAAGMIGLDQLTKRWAVSTLADNTIVLIPNVFELRLTYNTGAAFSMLEGETWLLILLPALVSLVMLTVLFWGKWRKYNLINIGGLMLAAGGIGNLIDRVTAGKVTDFLYFKLIDFPIFNVADCFVVIGAALILIFLLFFYEEKPKPKEDSAL